MTYILNEIKARSKNALKSEAPFKLVFMDIITGTSPTFSTCETTFYNHHLFVDAYSKTPKLYGTERVTTE